MSEFLFGLLLFGFGIFSIINPRATWWLSEGWKFRNAEPSGLALTLIRVVGVIMVFLSFTFTPGGLFR